jgi:predicted RNA binding protein YcfA (HicA-like mRNA interferase family)
VGLEESKRVRRLYEQVVNNRKSCSFEDLERLLVALDFVERKTSGSHVFFKRGSLAISIPKRKPVKETYVEQALELIERLRGEP